MNKKFWAVIAVATILSVSGATAYTNYYSVSDSHIDATDSIINATNSNATITNSTVQIDNSNVTLGENTTITNPSKPTPTPEPTPQLTPKPTATPEPTLKTFIVIEWILDFSWCNNDVFTYHNVIDMNISWASYFHDLWVYVNDYETKELFVCTPNFKDNTLYDAPIGWTIIVIESPASAAFLRRTDFWSDERGCAIYQWNVTSLQVNPSGFIGPNFGEVVTWTADGWHWT